MTTTINASTTAGLVQTADTSGLLALQTAGTTAVTVNASQNVGIGTASPSSRLTTSGTTGTANGLTIIDTDYSNDTHQIYGNNSLHLSAGTGGAGAILFRTAGTERARFNSTGALVLAGGTTTANGIGITFPATQSASTDANTLDDYEEGSWTPGLTSSTTPISATISSAGRYTKIGNFVVLWGSIYVSAVSSATGSYLRITGLPFSFATSGLEGMPSGSFGPYAGFTGLSASDNLVVGASGSAELNIWIASGNGSFGTGASGANIQATTNFYFSITGRVA